MGSKKNLYKWRDVTDCFTEKQRHYKNTYLEVDEVYNEEVEVSVFSAPEGEDYEIYVSYDRMYGIVYAGSEDVYDIRDQIKEDLANAYDESKEVSDEYITYFVKKYDIQMPMDTLFDLDITKLFDAFSKF